MNFKSIILGLLTLTIIGLTSCNKDSDPTLASGDVFQFAAVQNKGEIKGWKFENGAIVTMTSAEISAIADDEEAFNEDLDNMSGSIAILADNKATVTDPDGDQFTADYTLNGKTLVLTVMEQGFTISFAYELDGDNLIRKAFSSYSGDGTIFSFSTFGTPWFEGAEESTRDQLTSEGEKTLYMYYEERFTR
ncbi:MAG: hypothetical protein AAF990_00400 [Bacteroidota bacterium]